jgi:hypothetical protein
VRTVARHKIYVGVRPWHGAAAGEQKFISNRSSITEYDININADTNDGKDKEGFINLNNENGEVIVEVNCPNYHVRVNEAATVGGRAIHA